MQLITLLTAAAVGVTGIAATALPESVYMPPLPRAVREDLASRDPSEYQLFKPSSLAKREDAPGAISRCTKSSCLSYTFDDGPGQYSRVVTDQAIKDGVKVTFFVNVLNYDCAYTSPQSDNLLYAYQNGMQICSHTATHRDLDTLSHDEIDQQVELVETMLHKVIGAVPACIRPPYGSANASTIQYLKQNHGLDVILWNVDSGDSTGSTVAQSETILRGIKSPKHAIILMHEVYKSTAQKLWPAAFGIAKKNGYKAKNVYTVAAGAGLNPYKSVTKPGKRDSSWNCNNLPASGD